MHAQDAEFGEPLGSLMVVVFPIELRGTLIRQGELPLVVGKVGYGEGYYEVFARGWSGARRPVDCRIVRRSSPIINLLFTPCTLKKEISDLCRRSGGFIRASPEKNRHTKIKVEPPVTLRKSKMFTCSQPN